MKKRWMILFLLAATAVLCVGCGNIQINAYAHHDRYTAGDAEIPGPVTALEIDWVDGGVTVQFGSQSGVSVSETARWALRDDERLHWWLDGGTLRIQYAASGLRNMKSLNKQLTVILPENTVLDSARIASVSGQVTLSPLYAGQTDVSSVSGNIQGRIAADALKLNTVSGTVSVEAAANEMTWNTTSGRIAATVENGKQLRVNSISGAVELTVIRMPEALDVNTVSGAVTLFLPRDAAFAASLNSVSGAIQNTFDAAPGANSRVSVDTVSGGITVRRVKE